MLGCFIVYKNYTSVIQNLKIPNKSLEILPKSLKFSLIDLPFTYWLLEITFYLLIWYFAEYYFLIVLWFPYWLIWTCCLFMRFFPTWKIKEGNNIQKIRVLLGNTESNIYVKFKINFPVFLLWFFLLLVFICVYSPPILHFCYHLFWGLCPWGQ